MNSNYVAASAVAFLVGLIHSVLGEVTIFARMRAGGVVPSAGGQLLLGRHVRILWASWHALTVFGWGFAGILIWLSLPPSPAAGQAFLPQVIAATMLASGVIVAVGTKGRHPGWIGLLAVAILTWLG